MRKFIHLSNNGASFSWWFSVVALIALTHLVASEAAAQTWSYQAYGTRAGGVQPTAPGYVTLENKDERAVFTMSAGSLNICYQGELNAVVTKTEATTIITIVPRLTGCEEVRFVIKNDGTGGQREIKTGTEWVWDGFDRRLTPRK